jgi:hypothetical protein
MFYVWTDKVLDNLVIVQEQLSASVPPLHTFVRALYIVILMQFSILLANTSAIQAVFPVRKGQH